MALHSILVEDIETILEELGDRLGKELQSSRVLITGANGFLLSYVVDILASLNENYDAGIDVVALDNLKTGLSSRLAHLANRSDINVVKHDIAHAHDLSGPFDWIVHGASIASPTVYRQFPLETIDANVTGTRHMLELARRAQTRGMLVMSTSEIYGDPPPECIPTLEEYRGHVSCTGPRACYDESKRMAETLSFTYHRCFGLPVKIIRPFNVYGPGFRLDDKRILPDLLTMLFENCKLELFSDGRPTRAFCYVTDAIRAMLLILISDESGSAFNVGNDEAEISMLELAQSVADVGAAVLDRPRLEVSYAKSADHDYLMDNPQRRCPDLTKLRKRMNWVPRVPLTAGLERMIRSYL